MTTQGAYHNCKSSYCNRWFPKSEGDYCTLHANGQNSTGIRSQCEFTSGLNRCGVFTIGSKNGKALCTQHMFESETTALVVLPTGKELFNLEPDPFFDFSSAENIEWDIYKSSNCNRWEKKKWRPVDSIHFRFKLKGPEKNQHLFHAMLRSADNEYPLDPERKRSLPLEICSECGGVFWHNAVPEPDEIKRAAKQAGLKKIQILKWKSARTCKGTLVKKIWSHGVAA